MGQKANFSSPKISAKYYPPICNHLENSTKQNKKKYI